jgi:dihydrofolate synthase / folylpolyglutamate synthase
MCIEYKDTINWMYSQLPMYQNKGKAAYKADLSNTIKLSKHLNFPETKFKSIHIAGTNGKGSTSHMVASILQEAGYKTGLYTSPHLKDFKERIKLNGTHITEQFVIDFIKKNKSFFEANSLSFFEMTVGMASDFFAKQKVDIAVIEVGLGGRLDSTNIILPEVSVITNIGFDHMQFLGNTLKKIATEKGGIIKQNVPVVIGETQNETKSIFINLAKKNKALIYFADELVTTDYPTDLKGNYQRHNVKTTIQTIAEIRKKGFNISEKNIKKGLLTVLNNTDIKGRWQVLQTTPKVICDIAHNKEGLTYVMHQIKSEIFNNLHIVLGMVNDKEIDNLIDLFPKKANYYFSKPTIERGLDAKILMDHFVKKGLKGNIYKTVKAALDSAKKNADRNDLIFVGGSTFVVAEII